MFCENMSDIAMTKNLVLHARLKHIELMYHFIRNLVKEGEIELKFINTKEQITNVFTNTLIQDKFEYLRKMMKITS